MGDADCTIWSLDTETTTYRDYVIDGCVRVYLWCAKRMDLDEYVTGSDADSLIDWLSRKDVKTVWIYNLKFDGFFILDRLMREYGWVTTDGKPQKRTTRDFDVLVTDMGQWMSMKLRFGNHVVQLKDAAKKFPGFSLQEVARIYGIEGKSHLDVLKRRPPSYVPTDEDILRCSGDVRILDHAMRDLYTRGMDRLTMASDAKRFFKMQWIQDYPGRWMSLWKSTFAELTKEEDAWIREAYRGGWCFVNPIWEGTDIWIPDIHRCLHVYDDNSLYPSRMLQDLPVGKPIPSDKPIPGMLYIVKFSAVFRLKKDALPFIQMRHSVRYAEAEFIRDSGGLLLELTLTDVDYRLFKDMYEVDLECGHEYICFEKLPGRIIFGHYIDFWMQKKEDASIRKKQGDPVAEADRSTAKRFLNSLYGKLAESPVKMRKIPVMEEDRIIWHNQDEEGSGWYLPMACWITAYGRDLTIRTAHSFGDRFVYSDTDSVHVLGEEVPSSMEIHDSKLGAWKLESACIRARVVGAKKYIHEGVFVLKDGKPKIQAIREVACAGMPKGCKEHVHWGDFRIGMSYPGKLQGQSVEGGYLLTETTFTITR